MAEPSPAKRLREIARDIRGLPDIKHFQPGHIAEIAGGLLAEAVEQWRAFDGPEHPTLRNLFRGARVRCGDDWQSVCWMEAISVLTPELIEEHGVVTSMVLACNPIADLIDGEAGKLKAGGDAPAETEGPAHSQDFRSVNWYGTEYSFTPTQAACVKVLWGNWERETPEVGEQSILEDERVESSQNRLSHVFDKGKHPAWGTLIVPGSTKGAFRLAKPKR